MGERESSYWRGREERLSGRSALQALLVAIVAAVLVGALVGDWAVSFPLTFVVVFVLCLMAFMPGDMAQVDREVQQSIDEALRNRGGLGDDETKILRRRE
ncbi:MAG: hypothetical protein AAF682_19650 [Planctomycetota bacterium]